MRTFTYNSHYYITAFVSDVADCRSKHLSGLISVNDDSNICVQMVTADLILTASFFFLLHL